MIILPRTYATVPILGLPANIEPVALVPVGYPASQEVPEKNRKPLQDILF